MADERIGVYPGTFDPITSGHSEIVRRSMRLVDKLVLAPAMNVGKGPLFSLEERVEMLQEVIAEQPEDVRSRISIVPFTGLLVHFAKSQNATCIIRGLRAVSDFEYEFQMVAMNQRLNTEIETVFLMADPRHQAISSKLVKESAMLGGDISPFTTPAVAQALITRSKEKT